MKMKAGVSGPSPGRTSQGLRGGMRKGVGNKHRPEGELYILRAARGGRERGQGDSHGARQTRRTSFVLSFLSHGLAFFQTWNDKTVSLLSKCVCVCVLWEYATSCYPVVLFAGVGAAKRRKDSPEQA